MSKELSKTAENERIKLNAAYWNNIAVGMLLGGVLIPLFTVLQHVNPDDVKGKGLINLFKAIFLVARSTGVFAVAASALVVSVTTHVYASGLLKKLKD